MTDLTLVTATELSNLYQSGAASPVTVAEQVLAKIDRLNPVLNAFCFTDPATTLAQAHASEQRWLQGQPLSELDGVPVAVKDSILTQGWPTLHASLAIDSDQPWLDNAPAVARLREAGAVFVGKTTMSEFGSTEHHSNSLRYGNVCNPWNLSHTPGGSSGGSAVAVSAGLVPLAIGSDFGGSISVPSAFCGILGLKPSFGRIPHIPVDVLEFVTTGPMCRSTKDLALALTVISKPDIRDSTAVPYNKVNYTLELNGPIQNLRVALIQIKNELVIDLEIATAVEQVSTWMAAQGARVDLIDLDIGLAHTIKGNLCKPKIVQQWHNVPVDQRQNISRKIQRQSIINSQELKYIDLYDLMIQRNQFIVNQKKFMQSYDVILGPATVLSANFVPESQQIISPLSIFFCTSKQPTVTIPVGLNRNSMPMAVMIAGAMHDDIRVLQVANAIEQQFPMPHPPLFY